MIVCASILLRALLASRNVAPWLFDDELIYSELAKSFAETGRFSIRGEPRGGLYFLYPILISPAYFFFEHVPAAHTAIKLTNSVLMSLAALPAYLLARRVVGRRSALIVALLAVSIPSMNCTRSILSENAFYPIFLVSALLMVRAHERVGAARQFAALASIGCAFLVRPQAVALLAAYLTGILLRCGLAGRGGSAESRVRLRSYWASWAVLAVGLAGAGVMLLAREGTAEGILGRYGWAFTLPESVQGRRFLTELYHLVAELDLYLGVLPVCATAMVLLPVLRRRVTARGPLALTVVATSTALWMLLVSAAFMSRFPSGTRIEERHQFYLAPFFMIGLCWWIERGLPRARQTAILVAAAACLLPVWLPYGALIPAQSNLVDTLAFVALDSVAKHTWLSPFAAAMVVSVGGAGLFMLLPRRWGSVAVFTTLLWFAVVFLPVERREAAASAGSLADAVSGDASWVDDAVPDGAVVGVLLGPRTYEPRIWKIEFFNRAVGPVFTLERPENYSLPEIPVVLDPQTGGLSYADGRSVDVEYVLAQDTYWLRGIRLARDRGRGLVLYRLQGPLALEHRIDGLYPDGWTAPKVSYSRYGPPGGDLSILVAGDPQLFDTPQVVRAVTGDYEIARLEVRPGGAEKALVVSTPGWERSATVDLYVRPSSRASESLYPTDSRLLGVRYRLEGAPPVEYEVEGLFDDGWTGRRLVFRHRGSPGGKLTIVVASDPTLVTTPQVIRAVAGDLELARLELPPTGEEVTFVVPLTPGEGGAGVELEIGPTVRRLNVTGPAEMTGSEDSRELGVMLLDCRFDPLPE